MPDFAFSSEQDALRQTVRRFCDERSPSTEVRRLMDTTEGYNPDVWKQLSAELGLTGIHISENDGGSGFTFVELGIVLEEMGRALLCAPFFSSICLGANAIINAGTDEQRKSLLPGIAAGEVTTTLAFTEPSGDWTLDGITLDATGGKLTGTKTYVLDGHTADLIVVAAREGDGISFFVVPSEVPGLTRTPLETLDMTRKQAELRFDGVEGARLGEPGAGTDALAKTLAQAAVCLASECVGGSEKTMDMAVQYAKDRYQFGRPIGSFQAIKHKCADMLLRLESAKSAAYYAAWAATEDNEELFTAASLAKAYCTESYFTNSRENIQVHGGIGFTYEHDAHLYYRRAKTSELLLGDPTYHRELIATRLGI
ncbi:MAG: acyl-CoA dehydrogenase family protein [Actinomycetota bacterium]